MIPLKDGGQAPTTHQTNPYSIPRLTTLSMVTKAKFGTKERLALHHLFFFLRQPLPGISKYLNKNLEVLFCSRT